MDKMSAAKQLFALICLNAFAFVFDGQWVTVAVGVDLLCLGYDLKSVIQK